MLEPSPTLEIPSPTQTPVPIASPAAIRKDGVILYVAPDGRAIRRIRPDGRHDALVATIPKSDDAISFSVSPDGRSLLAFSFRNGTVASSFLIRHHKMTLLKIPHLYNIRWSPDGNHLLGTLFRDDGPQDGDLYVYNLLTMTGRKLPAHGIADWGANNNTIIIATVSQMIKRDWYSESKPTYDLYRYTLSLNIQERISYLDQAIIEFPRGTHGTDNWSIYGIRTIPDQHKIAFLGVPEYLKPGAGENTLAWYSIPIDGLEQGKEPEMIISTNHDILFNPVNASELMSSSSMHFDACSNPTYIVLQRQTLPAATELAISLPTPEHAEAEIAGVTYSPDGQQIAYGATAYECSQTDRQYVQATNIYISDVPTDFSEQVQHTPRMIAEGSGPIWVKDGSSW